MRALRVTWLGLAVALVAVAGCGDDTSAQGQGGSGGSGASSASSGSSSQTGTGGASSSSVATGGAAASGGAGGTAASGGAGGGGEGGYYVDLTLPAPTTPSPVGGASVTFYKDIAYGSDPLMKFDLIKPAGSTPTPLVIFIHGGGFTGGDKDNAYEGTSAGTLKLFDAKIAYATLNYRVLSSTALDTEGVIKPLSDSKRALQFIRYHASELGIDPKRIALRGGSAGAGTSLWLSFHDDMADPSAADPVFKQSTRVVTVAANSTQSTYDLEKWSTVVYPDYGIDVLGTTDPKFQPVLASFYGLPSIVDIKAQLHTPEMTAYRANVDMLELMTSDDPPFFVHNPRPVSDPVDAGGQIDSGVLNHHPNHARALRERATAVGVACSAKIEAYDVDDYAGSDWDYLINTLHPLD